MTAALRILPCGPTAFLAEYETLEDVMQAVAHLQSRMPDGVVDLVPAARTILVVGAADADLQPLAAAMARPVPQRISIERKAPVVTIEVAYDGVDLPAVAESCGLSVDEVIALHAAPDYTVAFCGFVPGFSYLVGLHPQLHVPRLSTPRTRVPAGAVAIASEFSAVYPAAGPGGWHLIGRTDAIMWDDEREVPALLPPGSRARFVPR